MEQKKITNIIQMFQFHFHIIANKDFNFTPQPGLIWMPSLSFLEPSGYIGKSLNELFFQRSKNI